jgi:hypothetical protein
MPATVRIFSGNQPAFTVARGASLSLLGIELLPMSADADVNSIEVRGGRLELQDCRITAAGFDCVKLDTGSSLRADSCTFVATREPAIAAKRAEFIELRKCQFESSTVVADASSNRVGVQAIQTPGKLTECTFQGGLASGIEWTDTDGEVSLDGCRFNELFIGLVALRCTRVTIDGSLGNSVFSECAKAIELNACGGSIRNCQFLIAEGAATASKPIGVQIHGRSLAQDSDDASFQIDSCSFDRLDTGLLVSQATVRATQLEILNSTATGVRVTNNARLELTGPARIRNSREIGIAIEGSSVELQRYQIDECSTAAVVVDGLENAFTAIGCTMHLNPVGIVLLSGTASLSNSRISGATTGILVSHTSQLFAAAQNNSPLQLVISGGGIESSAVGVHFFSPGSYQIENCLLDDPHGVPQLDNGLTAVQSGERVEVRRSEDARS